MKKWLNDITQALFNTDFFSFVFRFIALISISFGIIFLVGLWQTTRLEKQIPAQVSEDPQG